MKCDALGGKGEASCLVSGVPLGLENHHVGYTLSLELMGHVSVNCDFVPNVSCGKL